MSLFLPAATLLTIMWHSATFAAADGIHGNVTVLTRASADASSTFIVYQPYPQRYGTRTISSVDIDHPIQCSVCDRGAPTEYCYHDDGVCVTLSDTSVYSVHFQDGSLETDAHPLADGCTPRYLQRIQTTELVVVCRESCLQLIESRSGPTLILHDLTCGRGQGGIVVEASTPLGLNIFQVELDGNHVTSINHAQGYLRDVTPTDCTEPLSLHPIFTRDKFFLRCRTNDGDKTYILHPYNSGENSLSLDGVLMSSPDGRTFAIASNTTLQVYSTENLTQYPGAKDFGVTITFCAYLDSDSFIVLLDGRSQVLVHIFTFIDSSGEDGLTVLPYTSSSSPIHKRIAPDMYATSNRTGSVYSVQFFNISDGNPLEPVSNILKGPVDVFFFLGTGLPPPPLPLNTTPSPSSTSLPTPSSDEHSSSLPSETATAKPPVDLTQPKTDKSTDDKPTSSKGTSVHSHGLIGGIAVAVAVAVALILAAVVIFVVMFVYKRRVKRRGPYKQEKGPSERIPQPSPSSSGATTPSTNNCSYLDIPSELVPGTFPPH